MALFCTAICTAVCTYICTSGCVGINRCLSTAEAPAAMKLNFCLPHESIYKEKVVDQVSQRSTVNG